MAASEDESVIDSRLSLLLTELFRLMVSEYLDSLKALLPLDTCFSIFRSVGDAK